MVVTQVKVSPSDASRGSSRFSLVKLGRHNWDQETLAEALRGETLTEVELGDLRSHLWTLGFKTLKKMMRTGTIDRVTQGVARPVRWVGTHKSALSVHEDLRDEVAAEVLLLANELFFRKFSKQWDFTGGASVETWFVKACFLVFNQGYLSWARHEPAMQLHAAEESAGSPFRVLQFGPSDSISAGLEARETVGQIYALAGLKNRQMLDLLLGGYSAVEVARELGVTPKTIEGRMRTIRRRAIKAVVDGGLWRYWPESSGILVAEFTNHHDTIVDLAFVVDGVGMFEAPGAVQRDEMGRGNGGIHSH